MRIAIVNDMLMALEVLRRVVESVPNYEVAWVAKDGEQAVDLCAKDIPDLILMDLIMPVMDGAEATRIIMERSPCCVLVVTATVEGNASKVFEAMGYGAMDAVATPVLGAGGEIDGAKDLLTKIDRLRHLIKPRFDASKSSILRVKETGLIVIGSSTGGPNALATIMKSLPVDLPASIIVIQHVDQHFAAGMAEWLGRQTELPVQVAVEGEKPQAGRVYMAATNDHLVLSDNHSFVYTPDPMGNPFRPSADVLFESVAANWRGQGAAVLLTGIGRDGAKGMLTLKNMGWPTIAQDKDSCVVYGMPKAAVELGAASEVLEPVRIASRLIEIAKGFKHD